MLRANITNDPTEDIKRTEHPLCQYWSCTAIFPRTRKQGVIIILLTVQTLKQLLWALKFGKLIFEILGVKYSFAFEC